MDILKKLGRNTMKALNGAHRSDEDEVIVGVCGGIAETTRIPSWVIRLAFLISVVYYGTGIFLYILLAIVLPVANEVKEKAEQSQTADETA